MATVTLTKSFKAPISKVWQALTDKEAMKKWYFHVKDFELKEGNVFTFYETEEGGKYIHRCEILQVKPETLFEHTWEHPSQSKGNSILRWELESKGDETQVTLTHSGLENFADAGPDFAPENYEFGWKSIVNVSLRNYLYGVEKLIFKIDITAPTQKVWQILWDKETYKQWTSAFTEGSTYEGELGQGKRIHFLAPSGEGMYSDVLFYKENELAVFSHIGMLKDKQEQPIDAATEAWTGSIEMYRLNETETGSHLQVEVDAVKEYKKHLEEAFPKALQKLKELSEQ